MPSPPHVNRRLRSAAPTAIGLLAVLLLMPAAARSAKISDRIDDADGTWSQIVPDLSPPARYSLDAALYDPVRDRFVVGGASTCGGPFSQAFSSDAMTLDTVTPAWTDIGVGPADDGTIVYDDARDEIVRFGGTDCYAGVIFDATYGVSLSGGPGWSLTAGAKPPARYQHTAIAAPQHDEMLVFGGDPAYGGALFNDVWALSLSGSRAWSQVFPTGTPPPGCTFPAAIYDAPRDRMIVLGGRDGSGVWSSDVWALSLSSPGWNQLAPVGTPPPGQHFHAAYDEVRDRMLVAWAVSGVVHVWALTLDGTPTWSELAPAGTPPAPTGNELVAAYDPSRDRLLVQVDAALAYLQTETWALTFGEPLSVPGEVASRAGLAIAQKPNPGRDLNVAFTLPDARPAMIEAFDLAGRRVVEQRYEQLEPGRHSVTLGTGAGLAPGIYLVRLRHGGHQASTRAVIVN